MDVLTTIVIPSAQVAHARLLGAALARAGAGMYTTELSPTGALPATHFISSGMLGTGFVALLGNPAALHAYALQGAAAQGITLTVTLAQTQTLVPLCDVSAQEPFAVMARLGLQMVQHGD